MPLRALRRVRYFDIVVPVPKMVRTFITRKQSILCII
jgi:hypothetical protein